jgi:hypothetical protein
LRSMVRRITIGFESSAPIDSVISILATEGDDVESWLFRTKSYTSFPRPVTYNREVLGPFFSLLMGCTPLHLMSGVPLVDSPSQ